MPAGRVLSVGEDEGVIADNGKADLQARSQHRDAINYSGRLDLE